MSTYVLDNASEQTSQRFASLEACFDHVTICQLREVGVSPGWMCLEVGGGGGSIARWLSEKVGADGHVVVTDINPRWLDARAPNVELRRHDIVDDKLPEQAFDLAHARLVLSHLPERDRALRQMIAALKPGGSLLIDDFDVTWLPFAPACSPDEAALFNKVLDAFKQLLKQGGADLAYGRFLYPLLRDHGLVDVHVEAHTQVWAGGSPGCRLHRANIEQLRGQLTGHGLLSNEEVGHMYTLIEQPDFSVNSPLLVSARGRRPL